MSSSEPALRRLQKPHPLGNVQQFYAVAGGMLWLSTIKARTLAMAGDGDSLAPTKGAVLMKRLMKDASFHIAPGGDHYGLLNDAQRSAPVIEGFLSAGRYL